MVSYIIVSIVSGILFGILDGLINANPVARRLNEVYKPIAKTSINVLAGVVIDFVYGFIMAGIFLLLYKSLPGEIGIVIIYFAVRLFYNTLPIRAAFVQSNERRIANVSPILRSISSARTCEGQ